jgi:hypothetical protein
MREEIIATLAKFFKENGIMSRSEYIKNSSVPYTLRDIEKKFTDYAEVLHLVNQRLAEAEKVESAPATPVINKKPVKRQFKRAKEDSLDE